MFYIHRTVSVPFASTPPETFVVGQCSKLADLADTMRAAQILYPGESLEVVETLIGLHAGTHIVGAANLVPHELTRAVLVWNDIADTITPKRPKVRKVENFVGPYRRWKSKAVGRTMLLEDITRKVAAATWTHPWISFGWLFGSKDGTLNSEKLLHNGNDMLSARKRRPAAGGEDFAPREG